MASVSIEAANLDFENYASGNLQLHGQGIAPFLWSVTNAVGGQSAANARPRTLTTVPWGDPSGIVIIRQTSVISGSEKSAVAVLQSGIPGIGGDVTKHIFQIDISVGQVNADANKNDILLRPSGVNYDSGFYGWRAGFWRRNASEPNDRIVLQRLVASANGEVHTHYIPKSAHSGTVTLRATDDGSTLEVYANVSGTFELIHSVASEIYNDHTPSGALAFTNEANQNTLMNNYIITVESGVTPSVQVSSINGTAGFVRSQSQSRFIQVY